MDTRNSDRLQRLSKFKLYNDITLGVESEDGELNITENTQELRVPRGLRGNDTNLVPYLEDIQDGVMILQSMIENSDKDLYETGELEEIQSNGLYTPTETDSMVEEIHDSVVEEKTKIKEEDPIKPIEDKVKSNESKLDDLFTLLEKTKQQDDEENELEDTGNTFDSVDLLIPNKDNTGDIRDEIEKTQAEIDLDEQSTEEIQEKMDKLKLVFDGQNIDFKNLELELSKNDNDILREIRQLQQALLYKQDTSIDKKESKSTLVGGAVASTGYDPGDDRLGLKDKNSGDEGDTNIVGGDIGGDDKKGKKGKKGKKPKGKWGKAKNIFKTGLKGLSTVGKVLGPIGAAIGVGSAAYDGYSNIDNAGEIFGTKDASFGQKTAAAAGGVISGLTFGMADSTSMSKGANNIFGGNDTIERYESEGIIDHDTFGDSEIVDRTKLRGLPSDEIEKIIAIDDWSKKDLEFLKNARDMAKSKGVDPKLKPVTKSSNSVTNKGLSDANRNSNGVYNHKDRTPGSASNASYKDKVAHQESRGHADPYKAFNESSGAMGKYQFVNSTLDDYRGKRGFRDFTNEEFLNDPKLQESIMDVYSKGNSSFLENNNIETTDINMWMAHNLGAGNARKVHQGKMDDTLKNAIAVNLPAGVEPTIENYRKHYHQMASTDTYNNKNTDVQVAQTNQQTIQEQVIPDDEIKPSKFFHANTSTSKMAKNSIPKEEPVPPIIQQAPVQQAESGKKESPSGTSVSSFKKKNNDIIMSEIIGV